MWGWEAGTGTLAIGHQPPRREPLAYSGPSGDPPQLSPEAAAGDPEPDPQPSRSSFPDPGSLP